MQSVAHADNLDSPRRDKPMKRKRLKDSDASRNRSALSLATEMRQNRAMRQSDERRHWQRLPLAIPVFVHGVDERGHKFVEFATAMNISAGGAQLAIRRHLPAFSKISIEIPCSVGPYKTVGTQVRSNLPAKIMNKASVEGAPLCLLGLRFNRPLIGSTRPSRSSTKRIGASKASAAGR